MAKGSDQNWVCCSGCLIVKWRKEWYNLVMELGQALLKLGTIEKCSDQNSRRKQHLLKAEE